MERIFSVTKTANVNANPVKCKYLKYSSNCNGYKNRFVFTDFFDQTIFFIIGVRMEHLMSPKQA